MRTFFPKKEVVFIGLSSDPRSFSRKVYQDFTNAGFKVYAVNKRKFREPDLEVYSSVNQIPEVPECAYILLSKEKTRKAVEDLKGTGIKKLILQSSKTVDQETLDECIKMGLETVVACPRMFLSKGLMHRLHGFFAGIKK